MKTPIDSLSLIRKRSEKPIGELFHEKGENIRYLMLSPLTIALTGLSILVTAESLAGRVKPVKLNEETQVVCESWLKEVGVQPDSYIASKFNEYDLVLLGETHEVKENCEFVASLIPPLYDAGVRTLCSEFIASRFNKRLVQIVDADEYNEASVVDMFRAGPWPTWGYKEYMDIVRAVWAFNRTIPSEAEPFRIVGIDSDWKQIDLLTKDHKERFRIVRSREEHMFSVVESEVFHNKKKALVHIGFAHTARHGERLAARLAQSHGEQMFQVCMHHRIPERGRTSQFTGFIEKVIEKAGTKAVGFDVVGSPFSALRNEKAVYFHMLGENSTFQNFAEGYVFLKPIEELTSVTWVKGFIVKETFTEAKVIAEEMRKVEKDKHMTPADLDAALAERFPQK